MFRTKKKILHKSFYGACHGRNKLFGNLNTHRRNEKCVGRTLASNMDKKYRGSFEAPCMLKDLSIFSDRKTEQDRKDTVGFLKPEASLQCVLF